MSAPPPKHRRHADVRSIQRYCMELTKEHEKEMLRIIKTGGSIFIKQVLHWHDVWGEQKREIHELVYMNRYWRIVVDASYRVIVTVLPYRTEREDE